MTEDAQSPDAEETERRRGPVGAVVGATLGPFGAALGSVVDDTRFALTLSVGTGARDGPETDWTSIEIGEPSPPNEDPTDEAPDATEETDAEDPEH